VLLAFAILLDHVLPAHAASAQVVFWTVFVITMIALGNYRQRHERWFWKAMGCVILVHALVVATLRARIPFQTLGVVILLGALEAICLQGVVIVVSRTTVD
jgi:hypothetical protein